MPCYRPLKGYRGLKIGASGKRPIVFNRAHGYSDLEVTVPCGQCIGCRLEKSRQWAMRCTHEAALYPENSFITLTYDDDHLPDDLSVDVRHFQLFMKRLRKRHGSGIRFFHCGEYGEQLGRPHYHACLFNFDFQDKALFSVRDENRYFISDDLMGLWPYGFSIIGDLTFESAAYTARYITKKVTGTRAADYYSFVDPSTGEVFERRPEYCTMSRRPGIGRAWYDQFKSDVYPDDFVIMRGKKMKAPRFYDAILEQEDAPEFRRMKRARIQAGKAQADNNTPDRLKTREKVQMAKFALLKRSMEQNNE